MNNALQELDLNTVKWKDRKAKHSKKNDKQKVKTDDFEVEVKADVYEAKGGTSTRPVKEEMQNIDKIAPETPEFLLGSLKKQLKDEPNFVFKVDDPLSWESEMMVSKLDAVKKELVKSLVSNDYFRKENGAFSVLKDLIQNKWINKKVKEIF